MAKLGEVLARQFKKLGIDITTDDIKSLVALDTEVPDEISGQMDKNLLTIEAAKGNPEINRLLRKNHFGAVDEKMIEIIKESGVTLDETFANETNTLEKLAMLSKALVDTGKKKGEANSKEGLSDVVKKEREEFQKKEAEYQKQLKEKTEALTAKENEFTGARQNDRTEFKQKIRLFGKDYALPKDMDSELKVETALSVINKDLKSKGLVAKLNEGGGLVITDKDGNKAYNEKHEPIEDADSYFDEILSRNKLLNINDPNVQKQQSEGSFGAGGGQLNNGTNNKNSAIVNELQSQMKNMPN
ncbi:MAG: hypothetical protein JWO92_1104 [Chitinophagaceae bacterium]|nr:hypothetical protein [Chitinophagaceae bacterium]